MSSASKTIGIAILTLNAEKDLRRCLPNLLNSTLDSRVVIFDSSSLDNTVSYAQSLGLETVIIPRNEFNHGATREFARKFLETDIIVLITPDAIPTSASMVEKLVQPILEGKAVISYGRQIPHDNAKFFESFPRKFNYPIESHIRSIKNVDQYGVYTFFCSDSCAAYLNKALDEIGGFPTTLFGEDTIVTAKLLHKGYSISYTADAVVKHSHNYTLRQEFKRHFDMGLVRKHHQRLIFAKQKDSQRGYDYIKKMIKQLLKSKPYLLPYALLQTFAKLSGYRLGRYSINAPVWFKKAMSSQPYYWTSIPYLKIPKEKKY